MQTFAKRWTRLAAQGLPAGVDPFGPDSPWFVAIDEMERAVTASGKAFVSFGHYDYLSLARHPAVTAAAHQAVTAFGVGVGGSRLIGGERSTHQAFEREIAEFLGAEAALLIGAGYLVSLTLLPHLVGPDDLVVMDELMHSSSVHGAKASRAKVRTFRHNDIDQLEQILAEQRALSGQCLILVEGLYSMDGDIVDLPRLLALRDQYSAWILIDEAHSIGVLGATGHGLCEHFGVDRGQIDIIVGTLSKTFVAMGGFIAARRDVIDWLKFTLPGFVFSVGLSPVIVETARAALALLGAEPERIARLNAHSQHFLAAARAAGLDTGQAIGAGIVPVLFERPQTTAAASRALAAAGIYAPPVMQAGIKPGESRIRFFLSADHQPADIDRAIAVVAGAI